MCVCLLECRQEKGKLQNMRMYIQCIFDVIFIPCIFGAYSMHIYLVVLDNSQFQDQMLPRCYFLILGTLILDTQYSDLIKGACKCSPEISGSMACK